MGFLYICVLCFVKQETKNTSKLNRNEEKKTIEKRARPEKRNNNNEEGTATAEERSTHYMFLIPQKNDVIVAMAV